MQAFLDGAQVQPGAVGDEGQFEKGVGIAGADMDDDLDGFGEIGAEGRFAVAAQGDVAQVEEFVTQFVVAGVLADFAGADEEESLIQFLGR